MATESRPPPRAELRPQRMGEQGAMKAIGFFAAVQDMAPLGDARHAEIVGPAAEREHEMVVGEPPRSRDLRPGRAVRRRAQGRQDDFARADVDRDEGSRNEAVAVTVTMREVAELLLA